MVNVVGYFGVGAGKGILDFLEASKKSIEILAYMFLSPRRLNGTGILSSILKCFEKKIKEGVYISLIINSKYPNGWIKNRTVLEVKRLREMGVVVRWHPCNIIQHTKMIIVDREIVLIGSVNLTSQSILKNNECLLDIRGFSFVDQCVKHYFSLWKKSKDETVASC